MCCRKGERVLVMAGRESAGHGRYTDSLAGTKGRERGTERRMQRKGCRVKVADGACLVAVRPFESASGATGPTRSALALVFHSWKKTHTHINQLHERVG